MQHISPSQVFLLQAIVEADAGCHDADAYNICNKADYYSEDWMLKHYVTEFSLQGANRALGNDQW